MAKRELQTRSNLPQANPRVVSDEAARQLYDNYVQNLRTLIRSRLNARLRREKGTSDVAQAVFKSFFSYLEKQPQLDDSDSMWWTLVAIANCKIKNVVKELTRLKRDIRRKQSGHTALKDGSSIDLWDLNEALSDPGPDEVIAVLDWLDALQDDEQRIVHLSLEGYTHAEIAEITAVSERTVRRRFSDIRDMWGAPDFND